jgi:hypothetical protein
VTIGAASPGIIFPSNGNTYLNHYEEGTWTPVFTGLTVVNGTGGATYSGKYVRIGNLGKWQALITTTGTCTTQSVSGGTVINNLPILAATPDICSAASLPGGAVSGVGMVSSNNVFCPTWAATNGMIVLSGEFHC